MVRTAHLVPVLLAVQVGLQSSFVILPAVEHADDGYQPGIHAESDHSTLFVVRHAKPVANVIAAGTSLREVLQTLAMRDDGIGITLRNLRRCGYCDETIERRKLLLRFRRENDGVPHHVFAVAFLCSVASVARTWSAVTARAGSAFSAS